MLYLERFSFLDEDTEWNVCAAEKHTCYDSFYPFGVLGEKELGRVVFEPVTIFYGGNGSGKTTALNVMADAVGARRQAPYNRTSFWQQYVRRCRAQGVWQRAENVAALTSDDVFDYMLDIRSLNEGIDAKRDEVFGEYQDAKYAHFQVHSLDDYDRLKQMNDARRHSQSRYTREHLMDNVRTRSNGESAFWYFTEKITQNGLYFLDEPENSLSPARQKELAAFLADSARFFGCQFVLATHSPFLLALPGAKIYDLDRTPAQTACWTELENVRVYRDFFKEHEKEF
ncbi:AAA family ATPase [uncultured Ruthenibacterium sp.]|uniref:AAA family ATPase n=1 Tax=uncultured Ruthenibacterium sp. TaxID=1905347 RepID=UPI00349ED771